MRQVLPFAEWLPDMPDLMNPGAITAKNVLPGPSAYKSFPSLITTTTSLGSRCQGFIAARDLSGNVYNYAGDQSALYKLVGTSWSNQTRLAGGAYTTSVDDFWEFVSWGQTVIAVNGATGDVPQRISLGAANFVALPGAPNKARHIAVVRDFVVLGNISGAPQTVQWCAINNSDSWTADAATLADSQLLPSDGGWIQKIIGGEYGMVFQERAIFRMTFVGSPLIFQFDLVQKNIGAYAPQAVIGYENFAFFLSEEGFFKFDGINVQPIGRGKVDNTFFADLDTTFYYRTQAMIDPTNKIVMWAYPSAGNVGGNPNKIIIYNWAYNKWSRVEDLNIEYLTRNASASITLEGLDAISSSIDALAFSLDSRNWTNSQLVSGCFNSNHVLCSFNGSAMPATLDTAEFNLNTQQNGRAYITEVRPIVNGLSCSSQVTMITRNAMTEAAVTAVAANVNATGFVSLRSSARYHRVRLTTASVNFTDIQGIEIVFTPEGDR